MEARELIRMAEEAAKGAYAPYSRFQVGAALVCEDGSVYTGCNIENASYGLTVCAERVAIFKAVSEGKRKLKALAVAGREADGEFRDFCAPCGACRQVIAEFARKDMKIILGRSCGELREWTIAELLPESFQMEDENAGI